MSTPPITIPIKSDAEFPTHKTFLPKRRRSTSYPTPPDAQLCKLIENLKYPKIDITQIKNEK